MARFHGLIKQDDWPIPGQDSGVKWSKAPGGKDLNDQPKGGIPKRPQSASVKLPSDRKVVFSPEVSITLMCTIFCLQSISPFSD